MCCQSPLCADSSSSLAQCSSPSTALSSHTPSRAANIKAAPGDATSGHMKLSNPSTAKLSLSLSLSLACIQRGLCSLPCQWLFGAPGSLSMHRSRCRRE